MKQFAHFSLPLLIPLIYFWAALTWIPSPGARLILRDPSYYYLLGSMEISRGERSGYYAHPGAPLQALGAIGLLGMNAFSPSAESGSRLSLLEGHEKYLQWLACLVIFLNAILLALAGLMAARTSGPLNAICAQLVFFTTPLQFTFSGLFQVEAFLISAGSLFWICYLLSARHWLRVSVITGTLIATKLYFVSFLATALQWRSPSRLIVTTCLSFAILFAWCLGIFADPHQAYSYLSQIIFHTGAYAYTGGNIGNASDGIGAIFYRDFWQTDRTLPSALAALFLLSILSCFLSYRRRAKWKLATSLLAPIGAIALYLLQPTHIYYALPAACAAPASFWLLLKLQKRSRLIWLSRCALLAALVLTGILDRPELRPNTKLNGIADRSATKLKAFFQAHRDCAVILHGPLPYAADALAMGAGWSAPEWQEILGILYPHTFFVLPSGNISSLTDASSIGSNGEDWLNSLNMPCAFWASSAERDTLPEYRWAKKFQLIEHGEFYFLYSLDLRSKPAIKSAKAPKKRESPHGP